MVLNCLVTRNVKTANLVRSSEPLIWWNTLFLI